MPELALHDVQRDAGVEQARRAGVPEAMGAAKVDRAPLVVAQVQPAHQLAQPLLKAAVGVGRSPKRFSVARMNR